VVRYADTAGDNSDFPIPQMVKYRDWVIDAFNRDLPYNRFVTEQLAGDLLPATDDADRYAKIIATAYIANARRFGSYEDARYPWHLTYEDTIDNLGRTFLGLTVNCCRCHDHKFDPLTQEDYYALYGFFQSTRYPWAGIELDQVQRDLVPLAPADRVATAERERREAAAALDAKVKRLAEEKKAADKVLRWAEKLREPDRVKAAKKRVEELTRRSRRPRRKKTASTASRGRSRRPTRWWRGSRKGGTKSATLASRSRATRSGRGRRCPAASPLCSAGRHCRPTRRGAAGWSWRGGSPTRRTR
jgi:hypothetical protein